MINNQKGKITNSEIDDNLFRIFKKYSLSGLLGYNKSKQTILGKSASVDINIQDFESNRDFLIVFKDGVLLDDDKYTITVTNDKIINLNGEWGEEGVSTHFTFISFTSVVEEDRIENTDTILNNKLKYYYTKAEVDQIIATKVKDAVDALVNNSAAALDTLSELANALGNDPNFATTIATTMAKKPNIKSGIGTFSGFGKDTIIAHGLGVVPLFVSIEPVSNPLGFIGETWVSYDITNITVGNSGSYKGDFRYSIMYIK